MKPQKVMDTTVHIETARAEDVLPTAKTNLPSPNNRRNVLPKDVQENRTLPADDTCNEDNALTYEPQRTRSGRVSVPPRRYSDTEIIALCTRFGNEEHNVPNTH